VVLMTSDDYYVTMKNIGIADLKARLSEHIRYVRAGHEVTVLDRDRPVARIVPIQHQAALPFRTPVGKCRISEVPLPPSTGLDVDVVTLLLEERDRDR